MELARELAERAADLFELRDPGELRGLLELCFELCFELRVLPDSGVRGWAGRFSDCPVDGVCRETIPGESPEAEEADPFELRDPGEFRDLLELCLELRTLPDSGV